MQAPSSRRQSSPEPPTVALDTVYPLPIRPPLSEAGRRRLARACVSELRTADLLEEAVLCNLRHHFEPRPSLKELLALRLEALLTELLRRPDCPSFEQTQPPAWLHGLASEQLPDEAVA